MARRLFPLWALTRAHARSTRRMPLLLRPYWSPHCCGLTKRDYHFQQKAVLRSSDKRRLVVTSMGKVTLGIDVGTQSTKAILYDVATGAVLGRGACPHTIDTTRPGQARGSRERQAARTTVALRALS